MAGTPFDNLSSLAASVADELGLLERSGGPEGPGHSVVIEEQGVASPRKIILRGRAMPYQGVEWGGEQSHKITWYPGNPVATLQLLGPREDSTTFEGMWKDRFLKNAVIVSDAGGIGGNAAQSLLPQAGVNLPGNNYELAEDVAQLFHSIRRAGTLLRVQWLSETRYGILSSFSAKYDRAQDLNWEMSFEWIAWDDDTSLRSAVEPVPSSAIVDGLNTLIDAFALAPVVASALQATLVDAVNQVADLVGSLFAALETIDTVTDTPGAVLGAILNDARELDRELTELIASIGDVRWPVIAGAPAVAGPTVRATDVRARVSASSLQVTDLERWRRTTVRAAGNLRRRVDDAVTQRAGRLNPKTTRLVTAQSGTSLYDLARRFYGSPDFASFIASVNNLSGVMVPAGTQVRLPPRPSGPVSRSPQMSGGLVHKQERRRGV